MTTKTPLRAAWYKSGLTLAEISKRSGLHPVAISKIVSARSNPDLISMLALADALNIPLDQICPGGGRKPLPSLPKDEHPIRALLALRGWKQADLAKHTGISANHLSQVIVGKKRLSASALVAIASALGVRADPLARVLC